MSQFLLNTWYMGGWGYEVTQTPLARRLLGVGGRLTPRARRV